MFYTSWTVLGQGDLVFLSSPTAQSNKPHATPRLLPATSPEIRNFRGWVSPMSHSKQNQKGAALDNWSLLLQLQHQYFPVLALSTLLPPISPTPQLTSHALHTPFWSQSSFQHILPFPCFSIQEIPPTKFHFKIMTNNIAMPSVFITYHSFYAF